MIVLGRKIKNYIRSLLEVNYILILGFIGSKSVRVSHKRQYLRRLDFEPITILSLWRLSDHANLILVFVHIAMQIALD